MVRAKKNRLSSKKKNFDPLLGTQAKHISFLKHSVRGALRNRPANVITFWYKRISDHFDIHKWVPTFCPNSCASEEQNRFEIWETAKSRRQNWLNEANRSWHIKDFDTGLWYEFNDSTVFALILPTVLRQQKRAVQECGHENETEIRNWQTNERRIRCTGLVKGKLVPGFDTHSTTLCLWVDSPYCTLTAD